MASNKTYPAYVSVEPWIWNDSRVRALSAVAGNIFSRLLTCPQHSKVPGLLIQTGPGALRDEFQVPEIELLSAFEELQAAGLAYADWKARVVYCRPLLADMGCNRPKAPSRAAAYGLVVHRLAQKCEVLKMVDEDIRALISHSPSLQQSYLTCEALSTDDAERIMDRPRPRQQSQESFGFPERPEPAAVAADQVEVVPPRLSVVAIDGVSQTYEEAEAALLAAAPGSIPSLTPSEKAQLRTAWLLARQASWTVQDMADLGAYVEAGGFYWVNKMTKAHYVCSRLGEALEKMATERGKRMPRSPLKQSPAQRAVGNASTEQRIAWTIGHRGIAKGRPTEVRDLETGAQAYSVDDTEEELVVLERYRALSKAGELIDVAEVAAALEQARGGTVASSGEVMQRLVSSITGGA